MKIIKIQTIFKNGDAWYFKKKKYRNIVMNFIDLKIHDFTRSLGFLKLNYFG